MQGALKGNAFFQRHGNDIQSIRWQLVVGADKAGIAAGLDGVFASPNYGGPDTLSGVTKFAVGQCLQKRSQLFAKNGAKITVRCLRSVVDMLRHAAGKDDVINLIEPRIIAKRIGDHQAGNQVSRGLAFNDTDQRLRHELAQLPLLLRVERLTNFHGLAVKRQ